MSEGAEGSVRDAVAAAMDATEQDEPVQGPATGGADAPEPQEELQDQPSGEHRGPRRDGKGRFAPKAAQVPEVPVEAPQGTPRAVSDPPTPEPAPLRPPGTWKPEAREKWTSLPVEVQKEALRREHEISARFQETAEVRRNYQAFQDAVRPYEHMFQAEGSDPITAVKELIRTSVALRTAPPAQKAAMVAKIVTDFGVSIEHLDAALAGQPMPQGAPQHQFRDPRVDEMIARAREGERAMDAKFMREGQSKVEAFAADHEFFDDVSEDFQMIYANRLQRNPNVEPDMEQVYNQAVALNPEIARIMAQRKEAEALQNGNKSTQRAMAAGKSVKSTPAGSVDSSAGPKSIRDQVEAVWNQYES